MGTDAGGTLEGYLEWLQMMIDGDTTQIGISGPGSDYRTALRQHIHRLINACNPNAQGGNAHYNPWSPDYANDAEAVKAFVELYKANK